MKSRLLGIIFNPISSPLPRTSAITSGKRVRSSSSRSKKSALAARALASVSPFAIVSNAAMPTAIASGLPPKVVPCTPGVMPFAASAVARHAPTGKPDPSALASAMMSGAAPSNH